jgi:hypothetical protein
MHLNLPILQTHKPIDCRFASLGNPERIFAIPSIHGEYHRLHKIHETIYQNFKPGDRIIYLGNYTGYGPHSRHCINAVLNFRRCILSISGVHPTDITYLRGTQEEMWQKLMQLQFAPQPAITLEWMLHHGLAETMLSYGICLTEAQRVVHEGIIRLSRWTEKARSIVYNNAGHDIFGAQLKRAAYTNSCMKQSNNSQSPLLFVNAGIDSAKKLEDQGDCFWWGSPNFKSMRFPYSPYNRVIRGFDPKGEGFHTCNYTATLDNNCGRGGELLLTQITNSGQIFELAAA